MVRRHSSGVRSATFLQHADTRVIDQDVDAAEAGIHAAEEALCVFNLRDVGSLSQKPSARDGLTIPYKGLHVFEQSAASRINQPSNSLERCLPAATTAASSSALRSRGMVSESKIVIGITVGSRSRGD